LPETTETVERYFGQLDIQLQRTIATDDILAQGIKTELELRNARVGPNFKEKDGDLALISEWDTFYGQTLPKAVETQFGSGKCSDGTVCWIHKLTYLRGLDGLTSLIEGTEDRKQDKPAPQGEKQAGAAGFFKTPTDPNNLDRPVGQGQFDYLRRMSHGLHKTDDELRKKGRSIKAIGVLGSDVFDKLLVLRALRPEFPEALFFTTDFDEAYTIESELPWTRNLIIASSFGPTLNERIQREVPSFRSTYQTSAFLATLAAIGNPDRNWVTPNGFSDYIAEQLSAPRIFEISRSGALQLSSFYDLPKWYSSPEGGVRAVTKDCEESSQPWYCDIVQIHPEIDQLFPTFSDRSRNFLSVGFAYGAFLCMFLLYPRVVPEAARFEVSLVASGLVLGALMCAFWLPFALIVTGYGMGEPIAILQGVSVWPTVVLRILGMILALDFIWRAQRSLRNNLAEIADKIIKPTLPVSQAHRSSSYTIARLLLPNVRALFRNIKSIFDFSLGREQADRATLNVQAAWDAYIDQERFWSRRFWRARVYTYLMFVTLQFVLGPLFGNTPLHARSELAFVAYLFTTREVIVLTFFLTFFIFDATVFCLLFVNKLRRFQTEWPSATLHLFEDRLRLQTDHVDDWIGLEFVAKRTRCIAKLIYYPFWLIALSILAGSTLFSNYTPNPSILIAQGISFAIVLGCAIYLWRASEALRTTARENLTVAINSAKIDCIGIDQAGSAEERKDFRAKVRTVAQLETLLSKVNELKEGAFRPLSQQPLAKAALLPLGSIGVAVLTDVLEQLIKNGTISGP
jgi:hypothetical protein